MTTSEINKVINERFLELTDISVSFTPLIIRKENTMVLSFELLHNRHAVTNLSQKYIEKRLLTEESIMEIISNCIFIKDYCLFKEMKIVSINMTRNKFVFKAQFKIK